MGKILKKLPKNSLLPVLCVLMAVMLAYTVNLRIHAVSVGNSLGTKTGSMAGKAVGSLQGLTTGRREGSEAGKVAGLSAEDTEAEIASKIHQVQKLEVLAASVKLTDFHKLGGDKKPEYAALYLVNGQVVFTVDLSMAETVLEGDTLHIVLPMPEGTLHTESTAEKMAEYQKRYFSGSAEDGFDAFRNTMVKIHTASTETLANYDSLIASARTAAEKQIPMLVKAASVVERQVIIEWAE